MPQSKPKTNGGAPMPAPDILDFGRRALRAITELDGADAIGEISNAAIECNLAYEDEDDELKALPAFEPAPISLLEAIDAFPILSGYRAGLVVAGGRAYIGDAAAFKSGANSMGSGAQACADFIACLADIGEPFRLARLTARLDSAHRAAAIEVFNRWMMKGGLSH